MSQQMWKGLLSPSIPSFLPFSRRAHPLPLYVLASLTARCHHGTKCWLMESEQSCCEHVLLTSLNIKLPDLVAFFPHSCRLGQGHSTHSALTMKERKVSGRKVENQEKRNLVPLQSGATPQTLQQPDDYMKRNKPRSYLSNCIFGVYLLQQVSIYLNIYSRYQYLFAIINLCQKCKQ